MKKEELQKAWQEVQERLKANIPDMHIHETVLAYLEDKSHDLQLMLNVLPATSFREEDRQEKNK